MDSLEQAIDDSSHVMSMLPKQLQELNEAHTVISVARAAAERACKAAVAQQTDRHARLVVQNMTMSGA